MSLVAGHQIIGATRVGAFQKLVVVGVLRYLQRASRRNRIRPRDELKQLQTEPLADLQLGTGKHFAVFCEDCGGNIEPRRAGEGQQKDGALV